MLIAAATSNKVVCNEKKRNDGLGEAEKKEGVTCVKGNLKVEIKTSTMTTTTLLSLDLAFF